MAWLIGVAMVALEDQEKKTEDITEPPSPNAGPLPDPPPPVNRLSNFPPRAAGKQEVAAAESK